MEILQKIKDIKENYDDKKAIKAAESAGIEDGITCPKCNTLISKEEAKENKYVCPVCNSYFRVRTKNRIKMVVDNGTFEPWFEDLEDSNPLDFEGYEEKLSATKEKTKLHEAITIGKGQINGEVAVIGVCDARFLMSSMGHVVGEKIAKGVERATEEKLPVIIFCCSGGARMQEGIISLMQMAKTSAALKKHSDAGLLYISVLTDPTTGGVTASFAMLGDIILAEPGALIGFAGPRVIEQTIGQKLPKGFQRAEFLLEHGFVDAIVKRDKLKDTLHKLILTHKVSDDFDYSKFTEEYTYVEANEVVRERGRYALPKTAWEKVHASRALDRPSMLTYVDYIFDDFYELHGDRGFRDDPTIVGGVATFLGQSVTVIGVQKGNDAAECAYRNYGMTSPEGYRKALRLMKQAEKFKRPIICFVNTSGAYPGMEAEEHGQGEAIAKNLFEMSALKVPVVSIFIGEGGSGGALGLAVANEVWILENSTYSILSPEGFASILYKDGSKAAEAAENMKITAEDLLKLGAVEKIFNEYGGADAESVEAISNDIKRDLKAFLEKYKGKDGDQIAEERYQRFAKF